MGHNRRALKLNVSERLFRRLACRLEPRRSAGSEHDWPEAETGSALRKTHPAASSGPEVEGYGNSHYRTLQFSEQLPRFPSDFSWAHRPCAHLGRVRFAELASDRGRVGARRR